MHRRNPVLVYFFLVGLPLLGLMGILRAGRMLIPPLFVGGAWNVEADFGAGVTSSCRNLLSSVQQPFFSISQSGPDLVFNLNNPQKTNILGGIRATSMVMGSESVEASAGEPGGCADPRAITLEATVGSQGGRRILTGTLGIAGCESCGRIPFRAVRPAVPVKGRR